METEINHFAIEMQRQIQFNQNAKGDWRNFTNKKEILVELQYHQAKLLLAIKEDNKGAIREYIADCANNLMFLGVSFGLFKQVCLDDIIYEMKADLFNEKSATNPTISSKIKLL